MGAHVRALNAEINVTPFLDVLLVLIITFLAAMSARKAMDVHLPTPCDARCEASSPAIVLEVRAGGAYYLNRAPIAPASLLDTLRAVYLGRPEQVIQIAGHPGTTYQSVLSAMDLARAAGVKVVALAPGTSYLPQ